MAEESFKKIPESFHFRVKILRLAQNDRLIFASFEGGRGAGCFTILHVSAVKSRIDRADCQLRTVGLNPRQGVPACF